MPVIVDEVVVSVDVAGAGETSGESSAAGGIDRNLLIAECVERVLELLRQKGER